MSVPIRTRATAALAAALIMPLLGGCAGNRAPLLPPAPIPVPGQPAGTVVLSAGTDVGQAVTLVQNAITGNGGAVVGVVDNAAPARAAGAEIPANTVVIGGLPAAQVPMLRADQRAGAHLPPRYLVRQAAGGSVTITYETVDYIAAVSGVPATDASTALRASTGSVVGKIAPAAGNPPGTPLVGVTPVDLMITVFGSADVPTTVERLRRAARAPNAVVATVDMAAGSADGGPPVRPTTLVLVNMPASHAPLLAAAPSLGLELPVRFLVWLDEQSRTVIGYPDIRRLGVRHGLRADDPALQRAAADTEQLAKLAMTAVR